MNRCLIYIAACAVFLVGSGPPSAPAQSSTNYTIKKSAVDMGGPGASSTNSKINNAVGQAGPAWNSSSTGYSLSSGFLTAGQGASPQFAIVVDGLKDDFYDTLTGPDNGYLQLRYYAWNENGKPDNDADLSAKVWTAWDDQWFYLYEEVKDNILSGSSTHIWAEDCLELLFDPEPTDIKNSVVQTRLTALGMATEGVLVADSLNTITNSKKKWIRKTISGGYVLELAIQWSAIKFEKETETIAPAEGNVFGMGINQHDNDGGGIRRATVQWAAVLLDAAYETPKYLGTVKFLADHKLQFIPTNHITGVTNPVPYDGSDYTRTAVENASRTAPKAFVLEQNYPNPFNPSTTIRFSLPKAAHVRLSINNLSGQEIVVLANEKQMEGVHELQWDGLDAHHMPVPAGVYMYRLDAESHRGTGKLLLLK